MGMFHVQMFIVFSLSCFLRFNIAKYVIVLEMCYVTMLIFLCLVK